MKTIAFMTMAFLPATFFAALFALPLFKWEESPVVQERFWIYWATTLPSTAIIFVLWFLIAKRKEIQEKLENQREREDVVKRTNTFSALEDDSSDVQASVPKTNKDEWMRRILRRRKKRVDFQKDMLIEHP
jgi:hypothetical protein